MTDMMQAPAAGAREPIAPVATRTWTGEFKALLTLGWPLIIAQLAQNALHTTDVILMGWLGRPSSPRVPSPLRSSSACSCWASA